MRFGVKCYGAWLMPKVILLMIIICVLMFGAYCLGKSRAKTEIITKRVEVIKYVEKKKAAIYSRPNLERSALLGLMREGKL